MGEWDPTPWATGGGAEHSSNVARNVSWAAFDGQEGIVSPKDCEVRELAVPGTSVRVYPGTVAVKNRATGIRDEMYVGRLPSENEVPIASTDATGGRSDLIIARVENPHLTGEAWPAPTDPKVGPYIFSRVISDVPPTTESVEELGLGYSALTLARIDLPVSTGTITQDMITDLRKLSRQRSERVFNLIAPTVKNNLVTAGYGNWPAEMNMQVDVPDWATHAKVRAFLGGVGYGGDGAGPGVDGWNLYGYSRIQFGDQPDATFSQGTAFNVSVTAGRDTTLIMAGAPMMGILSLYRGTKAWVRVETLKNAGSQGEMFVNAASMLSMEVEFVNATEANL